ncbi:uncharacterized protein LOC116805752 [Drosophila grimshawi]|uniref:uncharacterized protein LOC116805752 n=1 Tax=Drosophila grimshawi TaxID=7222 RepID=UPI0013EEF395|nr:uncharacterized protein LOC116805752 [Drosophila grimshawi]
MSVAIEGRSVFDQLFQSEPRGGYYYPTASQQGYYVQPQRSRDRPEQQQHHRSYKDICRMVNTNGFSNPGNIPRCPY